MTLITPFDPWKSNLCSCPKKLSLSPYTGCAHGCLYCYASSYIRDFANPRPKKDYIKRLEKEIKNVPDGSILTIANSSDPYQPLEEKLKLTRQTLEIVNAYDVKINLVTKSSLVMRDLALLKQLSHIVLCISMTTINERMAQKLEPYASSPKERLATIEALSPHVPIALRLDPLIYALNTAEVETIIGAAKKAGVRQIITSTYKARPDNFKRMCSVFKEHKELWQDLYLEKGEHKNGSRYLSQKIRETLLAKAQQSASRHRLLFSTCREGLENLYTICCDGSALL